MGIKRERKRGIWISLPAMHELELPLTAFALGCLIHGLSHRGKYGGWCIASRQYLADELRVNVSTIKRMLTALIDLELVERDDSTNYLRTTDAWFDAVEIAAQDEPAEGKMSRGKMSRPGAKEDEGGRNLSHNNKSNRRTPNTSGGGKFKKPTIEEVRVYFLDYGGTKGMNPAACESQAERFVNYYESKGWKVGKAPMKSWQASVRNWILGEVRKQAEKAPKIESAAAQQQMGFNLFNNPTNQEYAE